MSSVWTRLLFITLSYMALLLMPVQTAADAGECMMTKWIDCFLCDSRFDYFCEDPFNKTDAISLQHTVKCDSVCLKWEREIFPGQEGSDWYIRRMCKSGSDVNIDMYLSSTMCITESRPGSGHMCTCNSDRCNGTPSQSGTSAYHLLTLLAASILAAT